MNAQQQAEHARLVAEALSAGPLAETRAALPDTAAVWVVGGTLRDLLLGRELADIDLAVAGEAKPVARALHDALGGDIFTLSERFGTWRLQPAGRSWGIDLTQLRAPSIERDLELRDFTVNAMALPLTGGESLPELLDPCGGRDDLCQGVMRVLGEHAYTDDPLRPLRLARLAAGLDFAVDPGTAALTARHAVNVTQAAPERVFAELRALVADDSVLNGVELLGELGLMDAVLPELSDLRGVEQSAYHHLDAYDHTLAVLAELLDIERDLATVFGADAPAVAAVLAEPLAEGLTRGQALRWGALLHDIAKRETRVVYDGGHVGFPGHDARGAEIARQICVRLRAAERFTQFVCALTREHLRLGFLVRERPLTRRQVYAYLRACEPVEVDVGVLSAADRRATRGRKADEAIESHLQLVRELGSEALAWRAAKPVEPLIRGDLLAAQLGIEPGPLIGKLLDAIAEARFAGEVDTADDAVALARRLL
ncbi:MAG: HD domain-containing protein [Actinobacteria bacterium]|nr:HD domain-containing protein [Actinomycetota bacterium]